LRQGWQQGAFTPLVSTATVQELMRVLAYPKFRLTTGDQQELLADFLPHTTAIRIPEPPPPVPDCRDPFDLPFLHLAVAGKARWLVSGDRDLLVLADAFAANKACRVVTLEAFMQSRALK
ncbi:MAG: putative toxin-antitoxin system toxin component, PIN family, partial [Hydrogenophaga sp.]|uniref:putative toxin-antitoxin system toxin component, PIN family n=1 Tax=Hydrogenophaga sp. TaxID=1904254 RepID=UPI002730DCD8